MRSRFQQLGRDKTQTNEGKKDSENEEKRQRKE
jgi:hypothetical protein